MVDQSLGGMRLELMKYAPRQSRLPDHRRKIVFHYIIRVTPRHRNEASLTLEGARGRARRAAETAGGTAGTPALPVTIELAARSGRQGTVLIGRRRARRDALEFARRLGPAAGLPLPRGNVKSRIIYSGKVTICG